MWKPKQRDGFTEAHDIKIQHQAREAYQNKNIFKPGVTYQTVKKLLPWVDPVSYDDMYKLSLKEPITIFNLEESLHK